MAESNRAAIRVQARAVEAEFAIARQHLRRKRFVQLHRVVIRRLPAGALFELAHRRHRGDAHYARVHRRDGGVHDARQRSESQFAQFLLAHQHQRRRAVGDAAGVAGGDAAGLGKHRRQLGHGFQRYLGAHVLVLIQPRDVALFVGAFDGNHFRLEAALGRGVRGSLVTLERVLVLLLARDLVLLGQQLRRFAHDHFRDRAEEAVAVHRVHQLLVAQAKSPARFEQVRHPAHRFGPARHDNVCLAK